jgi:predicted membrane-bound spermidine synthase
MEYVDNGWPEWGVAHQWKGAHVVDQRTTERGTVLEMVDRPRWGLACYMNGEIQSAVVDERVYHEALVHPAMVHTHPRRVLILGGGEGATAREVLKWQSVQHVDMYEWDREVVDIFRQYPQWSQGAWEDPRLHVHYEDAFDVIRPGVFPEPYDVIIIDLFEPDGRLWSLFSRLASDALTPAGTIVMYAGIRHPGDPLHPAEHWLEPDRIVADQEQGLSINGVLARRDVYSYKVHVPSFFGEAMFLLLTHTNQIPQWSTLVPHDAEGSRQGPLSHLTPEVWMAYHTWARHARVEGVRQGV